MTDIKLGVVLTNLGNAYGDLGDNKTSKEMLEKALKILEQYYGSDHIETTFCLFNLSSNYEYKQDFISMKRNLEKVL